MAVGSQDGRVRPNLCVCRDREDNMFLEHVNLTVTDLDASVAFYCKLLDFKVRWEGQALATKGTVRASHVGNDRVYLSLFEAEETGRTSADYGRAGMNHFGFVVDDLDDARRRLADLGGTPHFAPEYDPGRRIYVFDPDGIEIELVQYAS
jgi:catechol 2,3-dioxygenase-like lactoylglutathione lyase family enzyme